MRRKAVECLAGGEVLAREVRRADGTVLLGRGRKLTRADLETLRRLAVPGVLVEGDEFADAEQRAAWAAAQVKLLDRRFAPVLGDPFMKALHMLFRQRLLTGDCLRPPEERS